MLRSLVSACRRQDQHGLSLIEVLVALVLLGIATTLLASALARSVTSVAESRLDLVAAETQLNRLETLRSLTADSCPATASGNTLPVAGLVERWSARRSGAALDVVDSVLRDPGRPGPTRVLAARLACP
jgi:prepilin-type N-terminal cleavage/methylation domain-containing protein